MATSTLRAAIIVAALVLGGIVLANAFPGQIVQGPSTGGNGPTTPTTTTSPTTTSPSPPIQIGGAVLQVLNGTGSTGLAAEVATCLIDAAGAVVPEDNIGNAADRYDKTTLVHQQAHKALAEALRARFFPGAEVVKGPELPGNPDVQVTVIVGEDYSPVEECTAQG